MTKFRSPSFFAVLVTNIITSVHMDATLLTVVSHSQKNSGAWSHIISPSYRAPLGRCPLSRWRSIRRVEVERMVGVLHKVAIGHVYSELIAICHLLGTLVPPKSVRGHLSPLFPCDMLLSTSAR